MAELLKIHPLNPEPRKILHVVDVLRKGGIVVYPTDTIYGIGCDLMNRKAIERLCSVMGIKPQKLDLSFICNDLSHISEYVRRIDNPAVRFQRSWIRIKRPSAYAFPITTSHGK
jgi:tRNA threonylcarbamoyl adenosine modification protein (Sua5/YciO/YrdC/YwlC family)